MAFLKYRTGSSPSTWSSQPTNGTPLTNTEIDQNFATLNATKLEAEADTLGTVTARGSSTNTALTLTNTLNVSDIRASQAAGWLDFRTGISTTDTNVGGDFFLLSANAPRYGGNMRIVAGDATSTASPSYTTIYGGAVSILAGSASTLGTSGTRSVSGGSVEINAGFIDPSTLTNAWDGRNQGASLGNIFIGTALDTSGSGSYSINNGRGTSYISIGRNNVPNYTFGGSATFTNISSTTTTLFGDVLFDTFLTSKDQAGANYTTNSYASIARLSYLNTDGAGTTSKSVGVVYSPYINNFGGIRFGAGYSFYNLSLNFRTGTTVINGTQGTTPIANSALKVQNEAGGLGLSIKSLTNRHIKLEPHVSGVTIAKAEYGPIITLTSIQDNTSGAADKSYEALDILINQISVTGVDNYVSRTTVTNKGIQIAGTIAVGVTGNDSKTLTGIQFENRGTVGTDLGLANYGISIAGNAYQDIVNGSEEKYKLFLPGWAAKQSFEYYDNAAVGFVTHIASMWRTREPGTTDQIIAHEIETNQAQRWERMSSYTVNYEAPGYRTTQFEVYGKIYASNTITSASDIISYYTSDERLKTNIIRIDSALAKVNTLDGITFNWNEEAVGKDKTKREAGLKAQQVLEILPEVVSERADGTLAVKYEQIVPLLVEAIKELTQKVQDLRNQLNNK